MEAVFKISCFLNIVAFKVTLKLKIIIILMDIRRTSHFSTTRFSIQFSLKSTIYNHNYLLYIEYYSVTVKMLIQEMSERVRKRKAE